MITWGWSGMAHDASLAVLITKNCHLRHTVNATVELKTINILIVR